MAGIFISYRREDAAGHAGRLFDRLADHFGRDRVFMDVAGVEPGVDFVEAIDQAVGSCDLLLVVIGKEWPRVTDASGLRRLDAANDFVRLEVATALKRGIRVIPVLVEGALLPTSDQLPEDLQRLTRRQAFELRDSRWEADVAALVTAIENAVGKAVAPASAEVAPVKRVFSLKRIAIIAIATGVIAAGVLLVSRLFGPGQPVTALSPETRIRVPDVVGLDRDAAVSRLQEGGLALGTESVRTSSSPAGRILSQSPLAGTLIARGQGVDLVVAKASPITVPSAAAVEVPRLVGLNGRDCEARLGAVGLVIGKRATEPAGGYPVGTVVRQDPSAGTMARPDSTVDIVIAVAPRPQVIAVPDVAGLSRERAIEVLQTAGLAVGRIREADAPEHRAGTVAHQTPGAGEQALPGQSVDLTIATKVPPPEIDHFAFWESSSMLCYGVKNAQFARIDPGVGEVKPLQKECIRITAAGTTTYKLSACNATRQCVVREVVVSALEAPKAQLPEIRYFGFSPYGSRLCYGVKNARSARIDPEVGEVRPVEKECVKVTPTRATAYKLSACDDRGQCVSQVVTVPTPGRADLPAGRSQSELVPERAAPCSMTFQPSGSVPGTRVIYFASGESARGAEVYLDGKCQGGLGERSSGMLANNMLVNVPPGDYQILIRKKGYQDFRVKVAVHPSDAPSNLTPKVVVKFELAPLRP